MCGTYLFVYTCALCTCTRTERPRDGATHEHRRKADSTFYVCGRPIAEKGKLSDSPVLLDREKRKREKERDIS